MGKARTKQRTPREVREWFLTDEARQAGLSDAAKHNLTSRGRVGPEVANAFAEANPGEVLGKREQATRPFRVPTGKGNGRTVRHLTPAEQRTLAASAGVEVKAQGRLSKDAEAAILTALTAQVQGQASA